MNGMFPRRLGRALAGRHLVLSLIGGIALVVCLGSLSAAQQPQSRDAFENLLRGFIDNQIDRYNHGNRPQVTNNVPLEVQKARIEAAAITQDLVQMINRLQQEIYRVPALRSSLAAARQAYTEASVLSQRLQYVRDVAPLREDYRNLNQHLYDLAYQLQSTHYVSQATLNLSAEIVQHNKNLSAAMDVGAQLNRQDLISVVASMDTELRRLAEDIDLQLAGSPHRATYNYHVVQQRQHAQALANLIRDNTAGRDSMVTRFNLMEEKWKPLAVSLRKVNDRYLSRDVDRVRQTHRQLAELLRIPIAVDVAYLKQQVDQLDHDVHELYSNITLAQLVDLGQTGNPVAAARSFHDAIAALQETIAANEDVDDLIEVYWYVDDEWPAAQASFARLNDNNTNQRLQIIESRLIGLKQNLGVQSRLDSRAAMEAVAELEGHADHLLRDVRLTFQSGRYQPGFQTSTNQLLANFKNTAAKLRRDMSTGVPIGKLRATALVLAQQWNGLQNELGRFLPEHRNHLYELAAEITPLVVTLNTYLSE